MSLNRQGNRLPLVGLNLIVGFFLIAFLYQGFIFHGRVSVPPNHYLSRILPTDHALIPNIVHFVRLMPSGTLAPSLEFSFLHFIAIYSALLYLDPDVIYIHTNVNDHAIIAAIDSPNVYTRAIANLPRVKFNQEIPPNITTSGQKITALANQCDFVRTKMLNKHGGLYLDEDAYVLKNMTPLRQLGFQNVVGVQIDGKVCPAVMLAAQGPANIMMTAYQKLQDKVFDGGWETHSVNLLSSLTTAFSNRDNQVLTLDRDAFFSGSWQPLGLKWMYEIHNTIDHDLIMPNSDTRNATSFIENFQWAPQTWVHDWRPSYVLHGWNSAIEKFAKEQGRGIFREYGGITLDYVLSRSSNFAQAVYPAVRHALDHGILSDETDIDDDIYQFIY